MEVLVERFLFIFQIAFIVKLVGQFLKKSTTERFRFGNFFSGNLCIDNIRDIFDTFDKCELQSRSRKLLVSGCSPETVCQVVMFYATVLLDGSITTVMICQN